MASSGTTFLVCAVSLWFAASAAGQPTPSSATLPAQAVPAGVTNAATVPALDVISVKPNKSGDKGSSWGTTRDGVMGTNIPVHMMLTSGYHLNDDELFGEPDWAKTEHFDITGKVAAADVAMVSKLKQDQTRVFFQQVLKERFGLVAHKETRELPEYALTLAKGGAKIEDGKPDTSAPPDNRMRGGIRMSMRGGVRKIEAADAPIAPVLQYLSNEIGRTVVDRTGLTGKYSFTLSWSPQTSVEIRSGDQAGEASAPAAEAAPDLFTAIQEQLGLKLEPMKGPVEVVVIDHLERPGEN